ncbi:MAG: hypothetical protein R3E77_15410 [Steroidobacteraceae bacterium]
MKRRQRETEIISLSFIDCICCGFGAVILLLVLSEFGQPVIIEKSRQDLSQQLKKLQEELFALRGETDQLNRELQGRIDKLTIEKRRLSRLAGDISSVRGEFKTSRNEASVSDIVENELADAYRQLTADVKLLEAKVPDRPLRSDAIGGIPVDSEYIIFIIDTSNSMHGQHWDTAAGVMTEILDIYPKVKGLQVMDDEGRPMFEGTRGKWLEDNDRQRRRILERMPDWAPYSNSSPVEGIVEAIRRYWAPDKRISLYVLGDEYTGDYIQTALDAVAAVNLPGKGGRKMVRIHAIGFPAVAGPTAFTNIKFSALMRSMCAQNDGTFVGITQDDACGFAVEFGGVRKCLSGER